LPSFLDLDNFVGDCDYCVASGYCKDFYNHHWVVRLFNEIELDRLLVLFLYGDFDWNYYCNLLKVSEKNPRIKIFINIDSSHFDYALSKCALYLRPTMKDSFGIAVADAVSFGIPVLASDVCNRYPGAFIFTPTNYESFVSAYVDFWNNPSALERSKGGDLALFFSYF
jgi:glycosyltransferase involved in cell wall biosynthesis